MTLNKQTNFGEVSYESPSVTTLEILSEGVFCASYGEANAAGRSLEEDDAAYWSF